MNVFWKSGFAAVMLILLGCDSGGRIDAAPRSEALPPAAEVPAAVRDTPPIVFVHGAAGSAQQYLSHAARFIANGVPPERIRVFEYDAGAQGSLRAIAGQQLLPLYNFLLDVTEELQAEHVYMVGHSLGTIVGTEYLSTGFLTDLAPLPLPVRTPASLVSKFVAVDGLVSPVCPGLVPCKGIFDGSSTVGMGQDNTYIENQAHVEVATSRESFIAQYTFFYDEPPRVVDIEPQGLEVQVAGRAVSFPENTPRPGAELEVWAIDSDTGHRRGAAPLASLTPDTDGFWGPIALRTDTHYEFLLKSSDAVDHHYYMPRFRRDTVNVRLLSGPDSGESRANTNLGDGHAALVMSRMREWFGDHPTAGNDIVEISTRSPTRGDQSPLNVITPAVGIGTIGIHIHDDAATPGQTTREPLPYYPDQAFQTGVDVYMPATEPPDGTVTVRMLPRSRDDFAQTLNFPNWVSSQHRISILFDDDDYVAR